MLTMLIRRAVYPGIVWLAFCGVQLHADSLVLGNPPVVGAGSCDPFGCPSFLGISTYQQVYLSSAFPAEISIQGLTFFEGQVLNGGKPAGGTYTLSFSYTSLDPGDLSTANPADNIGTGSETFFTGVLPALTPQGSGAFLVITGAPFVYDPADGNLLLTVTITNPNNVAPFLILNQAQCGPKTFCPPGVTLVSSDAYFGTTNGGNTTGGLVTGFDYAPVTSSIPEPASLFLVVAGIGLVGYRWHNRRRSSV